MLLSSVIDQSTISVHFWNLSAYVSGEYVGGWVDLDECADLDEFRAKVAEVTKNAEEFMLSDYESDHGVSFSEFPGLEKVWAVHTALCELLESERDAFSDYLSNVGGLEYLDSAISEWRDAWCGQWKSIEDYAWNYADEVYPELANCPPGFRVEVDTIAWEQDHWISAAGNVFRSV